MIFPYCLEFFLEIFTAWERTSQSGGGAEWYSNPSRLSLLKKEEREKSIIPWRHNTRPVSLNPDLWGASTYAFPVTHHRLTDQLNAKEKKVYR